METTMTVKVFLFTKKSGEAQDVMLLTNGKDDKGRLLGYKCRLTPEGFVHPCHSNGRRGKKFALKTMPYSRAGLARASRKGNNVVPTDVRLTLPIDKKRMTQ